MFASDDIDAKAPPALEIDAIAASILGEGLPAAAERRLREAAASYHLDDVAETLLLEALAAAPQHPAVLIGLYRFYFYKGRLFDAIGVARACLDKALSELGLARDWRAVQPDDADFGSYSAVLPRFFTFTLKGYAYLHMRVGEIDEGREAVTKLLALDPSDKINAGLLLDIADRMGAEDED
ncbi:tetratricopeptide TPR_2 [Methylocella silvestris BL2]|uniref:Tetratricopeptide TPR_2 n=1 Tax=Methylocella silvestris (strain DSM 15510 / CIP 108128 / LMG 27833 / NCIMB 13906 / BL2) TaxID=395965 RepID=B8EJ36_METSB|nr:hypothetical protein [Methylocella silvestris]ACK52528.1 tetratricopeptide TPR_2 [Methylocella silvestris BL2]